MKEAAFEAESERRLSPELQLLVSSIKRLIPRDSGEVSVERQDGTLVFSSERAYMKKVKEDILEVHAALGKRDDLTDIVAKERLVTANLKEPIDGVTNISIHIEKDY